MTAVSTEVSIQTSVPEKMQRDLKVHAVYRDVPFKEAIAGILQMFLAQKPWLSGAWVKQPKTNDGFKPVSVKVSPALGASFEQQAREMEVSTSSLAYTAIDWYVNLPPEQQTIAHTNT
jgi:hypothetical protein